MPIDREEVIRRAEKLLRQGRLDGAIAEYARLVAEYPRDWNAANALGDLYVRARQTDKAVAQYARIAEHLTREGFLPKAAALYKKIVKIAPDDEGAQLRLAEISARQGLLADARSHLAAVAELRRQRGDHRAAHEIAVRLADVDPTDFEARLAAARALVNLGEIPSAIERLHQLARDLAERGRTDASLAILREIVRLDPSDLPSRSALARQLVAAGDLEAVRDLLTEDVAGHDPALVGALFELAIRDRRHDAARTLGARALQQVPGFERRAIDMAWKLCATDPEAAFLGVDLVADAAIAAHDWGRAAAVLQEYATRVSHSVAALLKLVEVCVDGGLEGTMYAAQGQLADAYLKTGRAAEARVIAEDLLARDPNDSMHAARLREALVLLGERNVEAIVAEHLARRVPLHVQAAPTPAAPERRPEPVAAAVELDLTEFLNGLRSAPALTPPRPGAAAAGASDASPEALQDLDQVFKALRDETPAPVGAEAAEEQLRLGMGCYEAGLYEEAIHALRLASRSPRHRFEAAALIGRIHREQGRLVQAVEWLERAAEAPAADPADARALLYDLGATLEDAGETARALAVFLELQAEAGEYRDVEKRVNRLARVQTGG